MEPPRKTIGILGGLGPESTVAFYREITRLYHQEYGDYGYPEIVIYSCNFQDYINGSYRDPQAVLLAIDKLRAARADFAVAACNSVHIVHKELRDRTPIPWVSLIDITADEIRAAGLDRVALLGTIYTMEEPFYRDGLAEHGISTILPGEADRRELNRIIYDELVAGEVKAESRAFVLERIDELIGSGTQGIILGCTELPFLVTQDDVKAPVFDTTALGARRALDIALGKRGL